MSISVTLKVNSSPVEKIGKTLSPGTEFTCLLKDNCSILNPVIDVSSNSNLSGYNYMYIPEFDRYYFINDIASLHNNIWRISGHVDVLETYKTAILNNQAVVRRQVAKYNTYLNDPEWKTYAYETIAAHKFSGTPFNKGLKYILTVAGA